MVKRINNIDTNRIRDVFGEIGLLQCNLVKIELNADAEPYSLTTPRCWILADLDASSRRLTVFITPISRFCFRQLPFGIAPEIFQRQLSSLLINHKGIIVVMDLFMEQLRRTTTIA